MKITITTIEVPDASQRLPIVEHGQHDYDDDERCCQQCDAPLEEERRSPQGPEFDEQMCADCELEYVNPRAWARKHRARS